MLRKILNFLERDKDITVYDEFHYIFITFRELVKIIYCNFTGVKYSTGN
jgi:hypothetical protein